jgi:hypothetical protein
MVVLYIITRKNNQHGNACRATVFAGYIRPMRYPRRWPPGEEPEINVTHEMIRAGEHALSLSDLVIDSEFGSTDYAVHDIYIAMRRVELAAASRDQQEANPASS